MAGSSNGVAHDVPSAPRRFRRLSQRFIQGAVAHTQSGKPFMNTVGTIVPPPDYDATWRLESLDTDSLTKASPSQLLEYLANLSPEISKGLWDYMRLLNPGWDFQVFTPGTETPSARGKAIIDALIARMVREHGSMDVVFARMHIGAYMRGAYFAELVLDEAGREALDIATPDPASVRFRVAAADDKKKYFQIGQWQDAQFVPLDGYETVAYTPVDAMPGNPYGRPLVAPAMFSALFLIGLLHDLRRVISQQGWPRIEIVVDTAKILESIPVENQPSTPEDTDSVIQQAIDSISRAYSALEPDDAWVHSDEAEIKGPVGVTATNFQGIGSVIEVIERMLVRALKTMPLMLGMTDGVSEANANRQWEIMVSGIKSLQHLAESIIGRFFEYACRVQGVPVTVQFEFAEIRAAEAQRDALTRSQEIDNEVKLRNEGFIDQDEASQNLVGHPPAEDGPIYGSSSGSDEEDDASPQDADENPDPGETKARPSAHWRVLDTAGKNTLKETLVGMGWIYQGSVEMAASWQNRLTETEHYEPVARLEDSAGRTLMVEYDYYVREVPQH